MSAATETYSAIKGKTYSSFASNIDLLADGPAALVSGVASSARRPCRRIRFDTSGNVALKYQSGDTDTQPVLAGEVLDVQATQILASGTTITKCTVYW